MLAIVCPGQGSQTPGFLTDWLEVAGVREHLDELSQITGRDLVTHGTVSDEQTIKDTAVAQPLIVAAGLVTARALFGDQLPVNSVLAGHSVGEITASALAGALSEPEAMTFVRERANAMAQAAAVRPTGMAAVLGGDPEEVLSAIAANGLTPANMNGGGQVVAAGTMEQIEDLNQNPPAKARVIPLKVAGAFHTEHMEPAVGVLQQLSATLHPTDPTRPMLSNFDGQQVASGAANLQSLVAQVSRPVRWDLCMDQLSGLGVSGVLELAPAGTLVGLARRGLKGVKTLAVKTPADLSSAAEFIAEHTA
ncbi:ACP S-malonyltransferase [Glutamicibacter uratoxydans]|uniref:ACP S-malonyltransferase n=1 Tax=Glutamicibacter uratoxydans TaxID=43667 RepID=UPI003D6DAB34